jgi:hypothetical protein
VVVLVLVPGVTAVVWFLTSSSMPEVDEKTTVNLQSPWVGSRTIGDEIHYDAVLNINKITPKDVVVPWTTVRIIVKASDGSVLDIETIPMRDLTSTYDDDLDGHVDVEFWYVETTYGDDKMSAGDALKITGMTARYEGAQVTIMMGGEQIGSIILPMEFQ